MRKKFLARTLVALLGVGALTASMPSFCNDGGICEAAAMQNTNIYNIDFDASVGVEKSLTYNGRTINFVAYENIVYVRNPKNAESQSMSIYIPREYFVGGMINGYSAGTAPIFMPNGVGGYMPGGISSPAVDKNGDANASLVALSRGLVVAAPAIRGRTTVTDGVYVGKAPALIVDYKAAVRYLRYNANRLPAGNVDKIISNGTSAGGALSAALGTMGNAPEFLPYLKEIGAADTNDDIFASSDYCPITNLDNADKAYEWIFYGENKYYPAMWQLQDLKARGMLKNSKIKVADGPLDADSANKPVEVKEAVDMTKAEIKISKTLRNSFPEYVNSLNLRDADGILLTLDKKGNGTFKEYIKNKYIESAQDALNHGVDVSTANWITVRGNRVVDADLSKYPAAVTRMKAAPAFDKMDLSSAENDEFATVDNKPRHFNSLVQKQSGGAMADAEQIRIMNPLNFIGRQDVTVAKHFRIRHGAADRDTSLAVPAILALSLENHGVDVDFFSPWARGHSGDYDLDLLFDWIDSICK